MLFNHRTRRIAGETVFGIGAVAVCAALVAAATHPARAASALAIVTGAVTCAVTGTNPCVSGVNTSSGIGVLGSSNTGTGVRGSANTNYGMKGTSGTSYGIYGASTSGQAGVAGTTASNYGVYGYTTSSGGSGIGVVGVSPAGIGVVGSTSTGTGIGVSGAGPSIGVTGYSSTGDGVQAATDNGIGLFADADGGGTGISISSGTGDGLDSSTRGGLPVYATNSNGNGGDFAGSFIGLVARAPTGGYPIVLTDNSANDVFFVTGTGDVYYSGSLHTFVHSAGGASLTAFSPKTTSPTVEDTGSAQLVAGVAAVRLDPLFAASIDRSNLNSYRVFLTPNGDSRGLFVPTKTAGGFIVRESQGGRDSMSFDYRIVATASGGAGQRMAASSVASTGAPRATRPVVPRRAPAKPSNAAAAFPIR